MAVVSMALRFGSRTRCHGTGNSRGPHLVLDAYRVAHCTILVAR